MKVPVFDLKVQTQSLLEELKQSVNEVLESGVYILGPKVVELEKQIADYCGTKHAIAVSSGTDALLVALMALEIGPGDLVLTPPYSFFATAGVVARLGAKPVFIDIDSRTYNLCPEELSKWFKNHPDDIPRVKAIIPVHLFGQCANMDALMEIAYSHGIPIIEDAAQAIGSTYPSKFGLMKAGSMSTMGCFSFYPTKNLGGIGEGGMVVTSDDSLAQKVGFLRNHGMNPKYYHSMIGGNFRLDAIQAAALLVKFRHLESWHSKRRANAEYYDQKLADSKIRIPFNEYGRENHIYNQYVISVPDKRNELRAFLNSHEIGNDVYYPVPFHLQECFHYLGYKKGAFPKSEYAADHTLALPIYPELTREMQDFVIEKLIEFYR